MLDEEMRIRCSASRGFCRIPNSAISWMKKDQCDVPFVWMDGTPFIITSWSCDVAFHLCRVVPIHVLARIACYLIGGGTGVIPLARVHYSLYNSTLGST